MQRLLSGAVFEAEVLSGGLRNTNYRVRLASEPWPVAGSTQSPSLLLPLRRAPDPSGQRDGAPDLDLNSGLAHRSLKRRSARPGEL